MEENSNVVSFGKTDEKENLKTSSDDENIDDENISIRPPGRMGAMRKGIYIVPSLITSAAFFCGFYAIVSTTKGDFYLAAWLVVLAMFFDGMDGRVARLTGSTSRFGVEYDSLSDLVAFGVAPALLMYNWALAPYGRVGWIGAFFLVLCGALRLARFNTQVAEVRKGRFVGLPIPVSAGFVVSMVLLTQGALGLESIPGYVAIPVVYILAFLMVSNIPYRSFKNFDLARTKPFHVTLGVILIAVIVAQFPHTSLFALALIYVVHGPIEWWIESRSLSFADKARSLVGLAVTSENQ